MKPPPRSWHQITWEKGAQIPTDGRNLQFQIKKPESPLSNPLQDPLGRLFLDEILKVLDPAIRRSEP